MSNALVSDTMQVMNLSSAKNESENAGFETALNITAHALRLTAGVPFVFTVLSDFST